MNIIIIKQPPHFHEQDGRAARFSESCALRFLVKISKICEFRDIVGIMTWLLGHCLWSLLGLGANDYVKIPASSGFWLHYSTWAPAQPRYYPLNMYSGYGHHWNQYTLDHHNDVTWLSWRLKSPATRMIVHSLSDQYHRKIGNSHHKFFVRPVVSLHKAPVMRQTFPYHDVIIHLWRLLYIQHMRNSFLSGIIKLDAFCSVFLAIRWVCIYDISEKPLFHQTGV